MAGGTKVSELTVTMDPSSYEAGAARVVAADDKVAKSAASMGDAVQKAGASVDAAGAKISSVDQRVTGTVSSFERLERSLRTQAGTAQLYQQAVDRVNATVAKHPELAGRAADLVSALGAKYLGTSRQMAEAAVASAAARAVETATVVKAGEAYESASVHAGSLVRESRALFDELSSGRSKQAVGSLTLLLTRGLGLGFGPVLGGAAALAIPVATIASVAEYQTAVKTLDITLSTTGRTIGLTRDQLLDLGNATAAASKLTGSEGRSIVQSLAESGNVNAIPFQKAAFLARDFGAALGKDASGGAEELGKMLANPSAALAELDRRFGIANVSLIENVQRMQASNDVQGAQIAVLDALAPKVQDLAENRMIALGKATEFVGHTAAAAYEALGKIGSDGTLNERIATVTRSINSAAHLQGVDSVNSFQGVPTNFVPQPDAPSGASFAGRYPNASYLDTSSDRAAKQLSAISQQLELEDLLEQRRRQGALASTAEYRAMQNLANQAPDLVKAYDTFGQSVEGLSNKQSALEKTLSALKTTGQDVGATFRILSSSFNDDADVLKRLQDPSNSPQARALRALNEQSSILSLSPGQRGLASNALQINQRYDALRLTPVQQRPNNISNDDLELQRTRELQLATAQYTTTIRDQATAMTMRTQAAVAYAEAISKPGLSPDEALAAGAGARATSAGIEAAYGTNQNAGLVAQNQLHQEAAAGLASVTEATTRLRMETDLLSQSDTTNAATLQASNRDRETQLLFAEPLAKAAADQAAAWQRGDTAAVAQAQHLTDLLNAQKALYAQTAADRDAYNAGIQASKIGDDLNGQLQLAQLRSTLQPKLTSSNPDDRVAAARSIAELQEQLALIKQFGPALDDQDQAYIKIAGDIAAINEATQNANQTQKSYAKAIDEIGNAGGRAFEQLATGTGTWSNRVHQALTSFEQDVAQIITKILVLQPLEQSLGGGSSGGSGLSGLLGNLLSSYFGGGASPVDADVSMLGSTGGTSTFNGFAVGGGAIGGYASGGDPPVDQVSLVGEEGPELFMPTTAGTIIPAAQTSAMMNGGGGGGDNHFHIYVPGDSGVTIDQVRRVVNEAAPNLIKAASMHAQKQVFGQIQRGGAASKVSGRRPLS